MLCFLCLGDNSHRLDFCEEIIRYSAYRDHGVNIGVYLIVTPSPSATDRYLYLIHRRTLSVQRLATNEDWKNEDLNSFPYTHIFQNIFRNRVAKSGESNKFNVQLTPFEKSDIVEGAEFLGGDFPIETEMPNFNCQDMFESIDTHLREYAPYTCVRIGPLPKYAQPYLFRFECHIGQSSFSDLIMEDPEGGTRIYRVYGLNHIQEYISGVDIPQCQMRNNGDLYKPYYEFYANNKSKFLIPKRYGIIAVDNPNCNQTKLCTLKLSANLDNLTDKIDASVYEHEHLGRIKGRLHWFMSNSPADRFFLHLVGPMALQEMFAQEDVNV